MASIKHSMFRDLNAMDMANPHVVTNQEQEEIKQKKSESKHAENDWLT